MGDVTTGEYFTHDRFAVTDGPTGTALVAAPRERASALALRAAREGRFWCGRRAGGCGGQLLLKAGPSYAPYFAHRPGQAVGCAAADRERVVEGYVHLALQRALAAWLESTGHTVSLEHRVPDGRFDVRAERAGVVRGLEVQLSTIPHEEWLRRHHLYRAQANSVDWLWGVQRMSEALVDLHTHGRALLVALTEDLTVRVGTVWIDEHGKTDQGWDELAECWMDESGLRTPHSGIAAAHLQQWRDNERHKEKAAEEAALEATRQAAERNAWFERMRGEAERGQAHRQKTAERYGTHRPSLVASPTRTTGAARGRLLAYRRVDFVEAEVWEPDIGWSWLEELPAPLRESARHLAYMVCRLSSRGPVSLLAWEDVPDPDRLQTKALVQRGFIELSEDGQRWLRQDV